MTRSERMAPVQKVLGGTERDRARDLGTAQQALSAAESKLQDLRQYYDDYQKGFQQSARAGQNALRLWDYQLFLARLETAVKQQEQVVAQARAGVAGSTQRWQSAARRVKAVDSVVDKWQQDDRRHTDRLEQKETDERASRRAANRTGTEQE
ncbi:MAG: flagellar export protein FliJ [Steroidobacteraceae bacterium]